MPINFNMELSDETLLREALGMSESKAGETLKNANLLKAIRGVIEEVRSSSSVCERT